MTATRQLTVRWKEVGEARDETSKRWPRDSVVKQLIRASSQETSRLISIAWKTNQEKKLQNEELVATFNSVEASVRAYDLLHAKTLEEKEAFSFFVECCFSSHDFGSYRPVEQAKKTTFDKVDHPDLRHLMISNAVAQTKKSQKSQDHLDEGALVHEASLVLEWLFTNALSSSLSSSLQCIAFAPERSFLLLSFHKTSQARQFLSLMQNPDAALSGYQKGPALENDHKFLDPSLLTSWNVMWSDHLPVEPMKSIESNLKDKPQVPICSIGQASLVPDLRLAAEFVSKEEEQRLIQWIDGEEEEGVEGGEKKEGKSKWAEDQPHRSRPMNRRVQHYGYVFDYKTLHVAQPIKSDDPNSEASKEYEKWVASHTLPSILDPIIDKIMAQGLMTKRPNQLTVNEYMPGQGISSHIDTHSAFDGPILSLSLGSSISFDMVRSFDSPLSASIFVPPRALLAMTEESRLAWRHSIAKRKNDRVLLSDLESLDSDRSPSSSSSSSLCEDQAPKSTLMYDQLFPASKVIKRARRLSLTFRHVRLDGTGCTCAWPLVCDSQQSTSSSSSSSAETNDAGSSEARKSKGSAGQGEKITSEPIGNDLLKDLLDGNEEAARDLENKHVNQFYEVIAEHFSSTRHSPWPRIARFLTPKKTLEAKPELMAKDTAIKNVLNFGIDPGTLVADVGCGNGKYLRCIESIVGSSPSSLTAPSFAIGSDISTNLVTACAAKHRNGHDVLIADGLHLPFRSQWADVVLSIAVFHHISTLSRRKQLASELLRICSPGGRVLVYAWAFEQEDGKTGSRKFTQQDCFVPWNLPLRYVQKDKNSEEKNDMKMPEGSKMDDENQSVIVQRYCHVFCEGELESLFSDVARESGFQIQVLESYFDMSNWCVLLHKLS